MIRSEIAVLARAAGYDAVAFELVEAEARVKGGLHTEAVMRLGRATEASLYAVAREFGVDLRLHIPQLNKLHGALKGLEVRFLKNRETSEVKKLADVSRLLSQAIAVLMESEETRAGKPGERVRANDGILSDLIEAMGDAASKRRLSKTKPLLSKIMKERNAGAHASPDGARRETDPDGFPSLADDFGAFIQTLIEVAIGERCHREFGEGKEVVER